MRVHLNARDVAVEDRRDEAPEQRAGVEARLQDDQAVLEGDERLRQIAAQAEENLLIRHGVPQ